MALGDRYVYDPDHGNALGAHHADGPLHERLAQPPEVADSMRGALAVIEPTDAQAAKLDAFLGRTMADLDLTPGTVVTYDSDDGDHPSGEQVVHVTWADKHGDARRTSIPAAEFDEHFVAAHGGAS